MQEPIIEIKGISKKYNITHQQGGYIAMRDILTDIIKHPFKFLKNKTKKVLGRETKEEFWALKNIDFEVQKGEAVGIIGANGAGKSTLLKILSKITPPTEGEIKFKGKMSSLLEVGTGFHPELTGRENIFLNGAILGMTKKEIVEKFDDIVEFAGIGKFLDTPVKRYSSGMYVRLAFAVAAHMEPDILVVDEVLAVGDAEFQKKCLGKMGEVTKKSGRTILFVSHNMTAIQNLCKRCILLEDGKIKTIGETRDVIKEYLNQTTDNKGVCEYKHELKDDPLKNDSVQLISVKLADASGKLKPVFETTDDIYVSIEYKVKKKVDVLFIDTYLFNEQGIKIFHTIDNDVDEYAYKPKDIGHYISRYKIPKNLLNTGMYSMVIGGRIPSIKQFFSVRNCLIFQINLTPNTIPKDSIISPKFEWSTTLIN